MLWPTGGGPQGALGQFNVSLGALGDNYIWGERDATRHLQSDSARRNHLLFGCVFSVRRANKWLNVWSLLCFSVSYHLDKDTDIRCYIKYGSAVWRYG